jgi:hypothetical protein
VALLGAGADPAVVVDPIAGGVLSSAIAVGPPAAFVTAGAAAAAEPLCLSNKSWNLLTIKVTRSASFSGVNHPLISDAVGGCPVD